MILPNGKNGSRIIHPYGEKIAQVIAVFCLNVSLVGFAATEIVYMPSNDSTNWIPDVEIITEPSRTSQIPSNPRVWMDGYFPTEDLEEALKKADASVIATITEVIPVAATGLAYSYTEDHPYWIRWWRVRANVHNLVKGDFSPSNLEFVVTGGNSPLFWPYVRGFTYYFTFTKEDEKWILQDEVRTSSLPPYQRKDRMEYYALKRQYPEWNWNESDAIIKHQEEMIGRLSLDVSIEKKKYLIITFVGEELWGGLCYDYGKSVEIVTNKWNFPLPIQLDEIEISE